MLRLPDHVRKFSQSNTFEQDTIPSGLRKDHKTADGVWGKIIVLHGQLDYVIYKDPVEKLELNPDRFGVVEPNVSHHVAANGDVKFFVEFYK